MLVVALCPSNDEGDALAEEKWQQLNRIFVCVCLIGDPDRKTECS